MPGITRARHVHACIHRKRKRERKREKHIPTQKFVHM
jgi:hypothetical protein